MRRAVYARESTDEGLDQEYNSIDAQRDAGHAYIASQGAEGWLPVADDYDDPAFSGGNVERPALQRMMADIEAGKIDVVVVYKIDRRTRSLADFSKMVEVFERYGVSFVSVTQQFNTTASMGRLMLNILLSFAQFEREVTGARIRDKIAASKRKGMWRSIRRRCGGMSSGRESGSEVETPPQLNMPLRSLSIRNRWYGSVGLGSNCHDSYHSRAASSLAWTNRQRIPAMSAACAVRSSASLSKA